MDRHRALRRIAVGLVVLLAYGAVTVVMTWPLAARSSTHLRAGSLDTLFHYWNNWWVRQALLSGQSPFQTPYLFHPSGISLVGNNFAWINIAVWLVLSPWVGGFAAHNWVLLLNLALCGFAMFLLARYLTGDWRGAFVAGLIYQCWPYRLSQLGHPNLISTQWLVLFLLFLIRVVRKGRWQDGLLAGLFLALTGYARWQQLIPAAIMGGAILVCTLGTWWPLQRRKVIALLVAGAVVMVTLAPPLLLLARQQLNAPIELLREDKDSKMQTDLLAYFVPSYEHPLLGSLTEPLYERYYADRGTRPYAAYVGAAALLMALIGMVTARRTALPWVVMALALFLLALGPVLRLGGRLIPAVPMPYSLAARLYFVRLMRCPDRFSMFLALPVAVLASYGMAHVFAQVDRRSRWLSAVLACCVGAFVLLEYLAVPVPLERPATSPIYTQLAAEPGDSAVLDLPMDSQKSKIYMLAQTIHQRPIVAGHVSRLPEGAYAFLDGRRWSRVLRQSDEMDPALTDVSRQLGYLAEHNIGYIVAHKSYVGGDRVAHWRRYLLSNPRFEDEQIVVYSTSPVAGRDFTLMDELAPGIGPIQVISSTGCVNPGGVLEVDVGWGTTAAPGRGLHAALALVDDEGVEAQAEAYALSADWPTADWPANAVVWGYYLWHIDAARRPGAYTLTLALVDPVTALPQGVPASLGRVWVSESPCAFAVPEGVAGVNALFGEELRLLGYDLQQDGARLTLTLYWRSEQRMDVDYKIFVHVFDPATTVPVAQDDAMPHRGGLHTTFWGPGEEVDDRIPISLEGVPKGIYGVAVGVYDPATLERLPVVDAGGNLQPDGRFVLPGESVEVEGRGS